MEMNNTLKELEKLKINMTYEKKKQYNAADRHRAYHSVFQTLIIAIGIINGSALVALLKLDIIWIAYVSAALSLISSCLAGFQKALKYGQIANRNREVADQCNLLVKEINMAIALYRDSGDQVKLEAESKLLLSRYGEINAQGKNAPTNKKDYKRARQGIESGEESYSVADMSIGQQT